MKFVSVRELRLNPGKVWKMAKEEKDVVLTVNGRPVAILTGVDENSLETEVSAIRRARALQALDALQVASLKNRTDRMREDKIDKEIRAARKSREG